MQKQLQSRVFKASSSTTGNCTLENASSLNPNFSLNSKRSERGACVWRLSKKRIRNEIESKCIGGKERQAITIQLNPINQQ